MASQLVHGLESMVEAGVRGLFGFVDPELPPALDQLPTSTSVSDASLSAVAHTTTTQTIPAPRATRPSPSTPGAIIATVDVPSGWIHLQSAYLDGQRKTKQFGLKNLVDAELEVEIDSDLGEQLAFWIPEDDQSSSSSSASSRSQTSSSTLHLILPPLATVPIGLAFQPSHSVPASPAFPLSPSIDEGGFTPRVAPTLSRTHSSELNLPLVPLLETASEPGSVSGDSSQSTSGISLLNERVGKKHETVYRAYSVHGSIAIRANATSDVQASTAAPSQRQNLALPFFASVCRSHFTVSLIHPVTGLQSGHQLSKGELHVDFGNEAVVGGEYHRDVLLVNRSEIDLVWSTSVVNSKHSRKVWVSLRDLDSENVFGSDGSAKPVPLPALSSRHLRLTLHVTEPVDNFSFDFVLSNLHQPANMVTCRVTGSASALPVDKSLKILSGTSLDFGEICDGVWAKKMITCKNSGDKTLDVSFSSDPGLEVVYRLAGVAGENMDDEMPQHGQGPRLKEKRSIEQLSRTSTRDGRGRSSRPCSPSSSHGWLSSIGGDSVVTAASHLLSDAGSILHNASDVTSSDGRDSTTPSRPPSRATSHASSHRHLIEDLAASSDDDIEVPFFSSGDPPLQPGSPVKPVTVPAPSAPTFMDTVASSSDLPNQIEELTMRPGTEYRILVMYRSPRDIVSPPDIAGALRKTNFRIYLDFAPASRSSRAGGPDRSRQSISCTAESCTSIIQLATGNRIDFGEVTVGASKSAVITIANLSALSARVEISAISKVLSTNRNVIIIPPFETVDEKVEFFPRRINDSYEKQLFVRNLLNRANDQLLEVRSKNVDVYNVTLHSHLYRILTPSGSNYLDFGSVVINCPTLRTIQFENLSAASLTLDLSASAPEDVELYARVEAIPDAPTAPIATHRYTGIQDGPDRIMSPPTGELKERFMETMNETSSKDPVKSNKGKVAKARDKSTPRPTEPALDTATKPSVAASVAAALKKGGRGRPVLLYGNAVVFKDRSLLESHEYLDLASGPPMAAHRMSPRSKRTQLLDTIELEDKTKLSGQHPKIPKLDFAAGAKASGSRSKDSKSLRKKAVAASPVLRADGEKPSAVPVMPPPSIQHLISSLARNSTPALEAGAKSPALTAKRAQPRTEMFDPSDVSKMTIDALLATLEQQDIRNKSTSQDTPEADEQFVRRLIAARKELQNLINVGQLVPVTSLTVAPSSTRQVVVVMTPNGSTRPHITTRGKRSDSRLFIKLADFDRRMLCTSAGAKTELDELPVRDLIIRSSCVRSVLEVQQSSINFGVVEKGETRSKTIVVHNRSDCIGVFRMRTSGSIASGNLKLGLGRYGVISAFGRKEVENFTFSPSLVGNFQETIVVENVLDPLNNQNVLIKAAVRKQPSFACDLQHIDFGMLPPSKVLPNAKGFVITNTSKHERVFVVEVETANADACAEVSLSKDDKDSGTALSKTEEEELEALLQKLKIARRKGKADKIAKYESRLTELGVAQPAVIGEESEAEGVASTGEPPSTSAAVTPVMPASPVLDKVRTRSLQITLSPNQKQRIIVELLACQGCSDMLSTVKIYERKNTDEVLTVQISFKASNEAEKQSTTSP